jgi:hypothetical protein
MIANNYFLVIICYFSLATSKLVFEDNFDFLDFTKWRHDLTLAGGGNNEFQIYVNNRTNTWTDKSVLYIKPVPTDEKIGQNCVRNGCAYDVWGSTPGDFCTSNANGNGCRR